MAPWPPASPFANGPSTAAPPQRIYPRKLAFSLSSRPFPRCPTLLRVRTRPRLPIYTLTPSCGIVEPEFSSVKKKEPLSSYYFFFTRNTFINLFISRTMIFFLKRVSSNNIWKGIIYLCFTCTVSYLFALKKEDAVLRVSNFDSWNFLVYFVKYLVPS